MNITNIDARMTFDGGCELLLRLPRGEKNNVGNLLEEYTNKAEKPWEAVIAVKKKKRSLDANAYMWVLCDKIAAKLGTTKEDVYRKAIKEVGVFDTLLLKDKAVENFIGMWDKQGIGTYAEATHRSTTIQGCTVVRAYYGSHTYDSKQMARLIDHIVQEAQGQAIETMSTAELERLVQLWQ